MDGNGVSHHIVSCKEIWFFNIQFETSLFIRDAQGMTRSPSGFVMDGYFL